LEGREGGYFTKREVPVIDAIGIYMYCTLTQCRRTSFKGIKLHARKYIAAHRDGTIGVLRTR
jgi:hypothetical protein